MARVRYLERADLAPDHQPPYDAIGLPCKFPHLHGSWCPAGA